MVELLGVITTLIHLYPFSLTETIVFLGVLKGLWDAFHKKQWNKMEEIVVEEALPLVGQYLSNEEKRDIVVKKLWSKAPMSWRMFVSPDQMEKFVDQVYVTIVKPKIDRDGIDKVTKDKIEAGNLDSIFDFKG